MSDTENVSKVGFGTFKGVFIPSILTVLGVIMYLRMGWVVGNVGLFGSIVIIALASGITFLTALSISATATNMKVGGGGAYYMISRSFGIETGAAIGIPLYLAQSLGITFYIAGFSESVHAVLPQFSQTVISIVALVGLTLLSYFSASLALRAQVFIFLIIITSLVSFGLGHAQTPVNDAVVSTVPMSFWYVFAVFFPAVTGIEAGISMSGDLKNPGRSLPRGTLAAVLTGFVVYVSIAILLDRSATPEVLRMNPMIMRDVAIFPMAIFLGIWGATMSSALGALLGAPRTLQALAADGAVPKFLSRKFGNQNEPRIATAFTFLVALGGVFLGGLDKIAAVLSMFFLTSYGALNLAAALEGLIGNPSWRPTFRFPWFVSVLGAAGCFAAMLMIDAGSTMVALFAVSMIYMLMRRRKMGTRWSDMRRGLLTYLARMSVHQLSNFETDPRTWRPNMLVLSGSPRERWHLIETSDAISHGKGLLIVATIIAQSTFEQKKVEKYQKSMKEYLKKRNIPALVKIKFSEDFVGAAQGLISDYGIGSLVPNTIVFGDTDKEESLLDFSELIKTIFQTRKNVLVIRECSPESREVAPQDVSIREDGKEKRSDPELVSSIPDRDYKQIDVWWGRQHNNAGLMLALAYLIQTSPEWVGSEVHLKSLVRNEDERQGVMENLRDFVSDSRIEAKINVFVGRADEEPLTTIGRYSRSADLVFIGMRPPKDDETAADYSEYYEGLLERTEGFPMMILTLAGEDLEFKEIFEN